MEKIPNERNLEVIIPYSIIGSFTALIDACLVAGIPHDNGLRDGIKYKIVEPNYLSDVDFRNFIDDGIEINYINKGSEAWVEILKENLDEAFNNNRKLENETSFFIPVATYNEEGNRNGYTKNDELKAWAAKYGNPGLNNFYSDPATINQIINEKYS